MPTSAFSFGRVLHLGTSAEFLAAVTQTAAAGWPAAEVHPLTRLADAPPPDGRTELLVLENPDTDRLAGAERTLDAAALPRWAIAILGTAPGAEESLDRADWTPARLARVWRDAGRRHELQRENARLRGELRTFGFRIAHDLRTPLGGVLTTTEMLREILQEDAPQDVPLVQPIIDSTDGLVKLIERTSVFAKVASSAEPPAAFDMGTAFWNVFQQLEGRILKAGATVEQPAAWPVVRARQAAIEFVWRHLLENAWQHGGPAGRIQAGWTAEADGHRFWLRSTAPVAPERAAALSYPFSRLHEAGAPRGLGLPMVRSLVDRAGGRCGVTTAPGGGAEFFFTLP